MCYIFPVRKVLAVVWWAWIPLCWQPLWGQSPGIGIQSGQDQKQQTKLSTKQSQADQRGTQDSPLVIDLKQHQKTETEAAEDKRKEDAKEYRDTWTFRLTVLNTTISALLLIVGTGGVYAAVRTLRAIEKQADLMERQIEASINRERARIRVKLEELKLEPLLEDRLLHGARYKVELHGPSSAFILDTLAYAYVSSSPEPEYSKVNPPMGLPPETVIKPEVPVIELVTHILPNLNLSPSEIEREVRQWRSFIHFHGFIKYRDVFDREHETRFRYIWHVTDRAGGTPFSYWKKCGTEDDNAET